MDFTIRRNAPNGRIIWSQDQTQYIIQDYQTNCNISALAKLFSVSAESIRNVLRKNQITIMSLQEKNKIKFPRNSFYFNCIDTPDKAYWLGFLYADGYITTDNKIRLNLALIDENHLYKFLNAIEASNNKIICSDKTDHNTGKVFPIRSAQIGDRQLVEDLARLGCVNKKSFILTFPNDAQVPNSLLIHFIRGYMDGDGSIHISSYNKNYPNYRLNFVGTKHFLDGIKNYFNISHLALENYNSYYRLNINGNRQVLRILTEIYANSTPLIRLERKYEKFLLLQNYYLSGPSTVNLEI